MKKAKITIWENGCGATVGRSIVHFTGIRDRKLGYEGVYVTLKYPVWRCPVLLYVRGRYHASLRKAVKDARALHNLAKDIYPIE